MYIYEKLWTHQVFYTPSTSSSSRESWPGAEKPDREQNVNGVLMHQSFPAVPIPLPADSRELGFFENKPANATSCSMPRSTGEKVNFLVSGLTPF